MSNRRFYRTQHLNPEVKVICGRLEDDDTKNAGRGWTGANTGTGIYTVTLGDKYSFLLACTATIQSTTGADDYNICIASHDVDAATPVIVFHVYKSDGDGTATLTDLGDTDEIHFVAHLQNLGLSAT